VTVRSLILICIASCGCANAGEQRAADDLLTALRNYEVVDLTHTLDKDFPYIPVPGITFPFSMTPIATLERDLAANAWRIHEHLGTQIDAPSHFSARGVALEALAAADLIVPAVVIDYRAASAANRDAILTAQDVRTWEAVHGQIPAGAVVLLHTGWASRIHDASYIGADSKGVKHFPGFGPDAARLLVAERNVWGLGVDTISFDPGIDGTYATHRVVLEAGKWALEALAHLERLPPTGAVLFIGAPKVRGATGGLTRVIGLLPRSQPQASALDGSWRSRDLEEIRTASAPIYLRREFSFDRDHWSVDFTTYADATGATPLLSGHNEGSFVLGEAPISTGTVAATFSFASRTLTAMSGTAAQALEHARCGTEPWIVGEAQDISAAGCADFRVPAARDCPNEYDVIRLVGDQLYLGDRPAAGDLCNPERRPTAVSALALQRLR
jgi:kynurenine formamidase